MNKAQVHQRCLFSGGAADSTATAANPSRPSSDSSSQVAPARPARRRSRASRRAPTTLLNTDTANFRAMVQQFTGIPSAPSYTAAGTFHNPSLAPSVIDFGRYAQPPPLTPTQQYQQATPPPLQTYQQLFQAQQQQQQLYSLGENPNDVFQIPGDCFAGNPNSVTEMFSRRESPACRRQITGANHNIFD